MSGAGASDAALERAASLLRCPRCKTAPLEALLGRLACGACHHENADRGGWHDLLGTELENPSLGQRLFLSSLGARGYELVRESPAVYVTNRKTFRDEVTWLVDALGLRGTETVVDVPCGQGNFTQALGRALPKGVVIGIDLSGAMLGLARRRLDRAGVENVVLLRGNALDLPLVDASVDALSNCGGLHLYPDPPRAIAEMRRVLRPGRPVAGLTFRTRESAVGRAIEAAISRASGARAFDFDALGSEFRKAGFEAYRWEGKSLIAWYEARRASWDLKDGAGMEDRRQ